MEREVFLYEGGSTVVHTSPHVSGLRSQKSVEDELHAVRYRQYIIDPAVVNPQCHEAKDEWRYGDTKGHEQRPDSHRSSSVLFEERLSDCGRTDRSRRAVKISKGCSKGEYEYPHLTKNDVMARQRPIVA